MVIIIPLSPSVGRYVETYFCTDKKKMLNHLLLSLSCRHNNKTDLALFKVL